jgi:hypothetical protein
MISCAEMQSQIDQLKLQLSNSIAQLQEAQQHAAAANAAAAQGQLQAQQQQQQTADSITAVSNLQGAITKLQTSSSALETQVQQVEKTTLDNQTAMEQPAAVRYKGVTIIPGGFLAGETVWHQKTLNADMYTNWNGQPYPGSAEAHMSEFVPSARQSSQRRLATTALPGFAPARSARASAANHRESISVCQNDDSLIANGNVTSKVTDEAFPQYSYAPRGCVGE